MRALEGDPEARRFSPLNAPQRAAVEAFCDEAAPWARRQARRTYGHLPSETRRQAIDRAMRELRLGAPPAVDRTTLYATLAEELTEQLRQVHAGWCLNAAQAQWRKEGPVAVPDEGDPHAAVVGTIVEEGLGGLERAVLQMEIGAGRDTRTSRAALRLGPRQYERHRTEGLSKLRSAINGHAAGRVCENHLDAVILAATGDREALQSLSTGPDRCRACAREASGLRRVLQERLAVAPWPLAIKPAGLIAAKLGFAGAVVGGKTAGSAGAGAVSTAWPLGTGAGGIAGMLAAAAVATGTAAVLDDSRAPKTVPIPAAVTQSAPAAAAPEPEPAERGGRTPAPRIAKVKPAATGGRRATSDPRPAAQAPAQTTAPAPTAPSTTVADPRTEPAPVQPKPVLEETVGGTVDEVRKTVDPVTTTLPPQVAQPVDQTLDAVEGTVDQVTGTVDELLP